MEKITESQRIKTLVPATMNCHILFTPLITSKLQVCLKLPSLMYIFFLISLLDSHYEILYGKSFCIYSTICYLVAKPLSKKIPMTEIEKPVKIFHMTNKC